MVKTRAGSAQRAAGHESSSMRNTRQKARVEFMQIKEEREQRQVKKTKDTEIATARARYVEY